MKGIIKVLLIVTVSMALIACGGKKEDEVKVLKLGYNTTDDSIRGVSALRFKEVVEEMSEGKIQIEIFPSEQLGSEQEQLEAVQIGAQDLQLAGGGSMSTILPNTGTFTLPFLFNSFEEAHALFDSSIGDEIKKEAEEHNYKILSFLDLGFAQISNNMREINGVEDFQGLKMRSPGEEILINTFRELGASVTTMPFSEVYIALSQGVIDGQFNPLDAIYENKFHEVQEYLAILNIFYYNINFIMSNSVWNSLDAESQNIIQIAANEARDTSREYARDKQSEMIELLENEVTSITYPETQGFQEKVEDIYNGYGKRVTNLTAIQEFLKAYREELQ